MNPATSPAHLELSGEGDRRIARLQGDWTLAGIYLSGDHLGKTLATLERPGDMDWNCLDIGALDSAGAICLWRAWGGRFPPLLAVSPEHVLILERVAGIPREPKKPVPRLSGADRVANIGAWAIKTAQTAGDFIALLGQLALDCGHLFRYPNDIPWKEISANLYKSGVRAMPVTAVVGFLIGVVLSYLSALQLRQFGADVFIINILGMGVVRELGPVLTAVLVAGRSGSAMTAQLGVMRVTEEIDALATMGISRSLRLIFPKVSALAVAMPLLVLWTSSMAILGGMFAAWLQLDMSYQFFFQALPKAVPVANIWIAQSKGVAFGIAVALVACHFGLRVKPNTESLSANTTSSVVIAITAVILLDSVFAIVTRNMGLPL